jgi:sulfonate transport system ATP-binding protein
MAGRLGIRRGVVARAADGTSSSGQLSHPGGDPAVAVRVRGLRRSFGSRVVLDDLHLDVARGECLAILGHSGCGKSTLLRAISGLDPAVGDDVTLLGKAAVVFQQPRLLPWKRVEANVGLGLERAEARTAVADALAEVGLTARAGDWPATLSGGEAHRVSLARALVRRPSVLLLDEPFASLDALTRLRMHALVQRLWQAHGFTLVIVTHDVDEALLLADRVIVLDGGHISLDLPVDLHRPRRRTTTDFDDLRLRLLRQLGVDDAEAGIHPSDLEEATR